MDANQHYAAVLTLMEMVIEHKDEEDFTPEGASMLMQSAQAQALAGILRYLLDQQPDG